MPASDVASSLMLLHRGLAANMSVSMATTVFPIGENSLKLVGSVVFHMQTHK